MYRIGVIGDYDSICGFSALGMDTYPVKDVDEAKRKIRELGNQEYGIIYITEPLIAQMPEEYARYEEQIVPAVVPIPSFSGEKGFALEALREYVRQAVGSDIIFNN